jgi:cytidine deaminase
MQYTDPRALLNVCPWPPFPVGRIAEFILRKFQTTNRNRFRIARDQLKQMQSDLSCTHDELVYTLLDIFKERALPEISGFHVAAAAVGYSGDLYMGVNLETPFSNLGHTVHAEQFVIVNAHMSKETGLSKFVVSDFPCGHCRQFLFELPNPHKIIVDVPSKGVKLRACNRGAHLCHSLFVDASTSERVCLLGCPCASGRFHCADLPDCVCPHCYLLLRGVAFWRVYRTQHWRTSCRTALRLRRTPSGLSQRCLQSRL